MSGFQGPFPYPAPLQANPFYETEATGAVLSLAGQLYNLISFDVHTNCHGATDTATVTLPISSNQDFSAICAVNQERLDNAQPIFVQIFAGYPPNAAALGTSPTLSGLILRFGGILDQYNARFKANTVTFQCRSLAAPLTTGKVQTPFAGPAVTTVDWIAQMCTIYGLKYNIFPGIKPLTMQQVLGNELATGVHVYPLWTLMLQCALQDDVDIWVDAYGTLWYYPSDQIPRNDIYLAWGRDIDDLDMTHNVQSSGNIEIRVHSYVTKTRVSSSARVYRSGALSYQTQATSRIVTSNPIFGTNESTSSSTNAQGVTSLSTSQSSGGAQLGSVGNFQNYSGKQLYEKWLKNATQAQCQDAAQKYYRQILLHEYAVTIEMPVTRKNLWKSGGSQLVPNMGIQALLHLSNAPYSQINKPLWPREITESFSTTGGWNWSVSANTQTPAQGGV